MFGMVMLVMMLWFATQNCNLRRRRKAWRLSKKIFNMLSVLSNGFVCRKSRRWTILERVTVVTLHCKKVDIWQWWLIAFKIFWSFHDPDGFKTKSSKKRHVIQIPNDRHWLLFWEKVCRYSSSFSSIVQFFYPSKMSITSLNDRLEGTLLPKQRGGIGDFFISRVNKWLTASNSMVYLHVFTRYISIELNNQGYLFIYHEQKTGTKPCTCYGVRCRSKRHPQFLALPFSCLRDHLGCGACGPMFCSRAALVSPTGFQGGGRKIQASRSRQVQEENYQWKWS